jgi:hypothetical protein
MEKCNSELASNVLKLFISVKKLNNFKVPASVIFAFMLLVLIVSCSEKKQEKNASYTFDLKKVESGTVSKAKIKVKEIRYIPLETTKESLIGYPSKILYRQNKFYILDNDSKSLFIFDSNGKFLSKIQKLGKGPGEYISNSDFDVDNNGNVYIWDISVHKLIKYSSDMVTFKEYKFSEYVFLNFSLFSQNKLLLHSIFKGGNIKYSVGIYDLTNNKFEVVLKAKDHYEDYTIARNSFSYLFASNATTYYSTNYSPDIYKIDSTQNTKVVSFSTNLIPNVESLDNIRKNGEANTPENYFKSINDIYECDNLLVFQIKHMKDLYFIILEKKTGKLTTAYGLFDGKLFNYGLVRGTTGSEFISILLPSFFVQNNWKDIVNKTDLNVENKNILLNQTENSNPVLMLYELINY